MPEVHCVVCHLARNSVTEGFYTIEDGLLTMVFDDGTPVILDDGERVTHQLRPADNARSIAAVLTGEIRRSLLNEIVPGFSRELDYPDQGIA